MPGNRANSPIGIIVAMDAELHHLMDRFPDPTEEADGIWIDRFAEVDGLPIVAVRCGIGMVNAAAATERLINRHQPRAVVNFGCTGAHRRDILPGDVVIGTATVNRGSVHILPDGSEYYVGPSYEVGGEQVIAAELPADPSLLALAERAAQDEHPVPWPRDVGWPPTVTYREPRIFSGVVGSSDSWTQNTARIDRFHQRHQTLCEDMEAAAIAQICALHGVPFLTIKDISNNEYLAATDITGGFTDFPTAEVGRRAADLVYRILTMLADATERAPRQEA